MVQFAERLTEREEYEALRDAGFGMVTGIPYPSESQGRLRPVKEWSSLSRGSLAMGYEIAVTPLQLALAYGAIANGGELLEPVLVKEIRDADGDVTFAAGRRVVRRVMSEETARTIRGLLREVVTDGTAKSADLATYELSGKSGTARRVRADGGGYEEGSYTASFVGLFPSEDPQFVILVKLDDPGGAYYGGRIAAPVTKAVLEAVIAARDGALDPAKLGVRHESSNVRNAEGGVSPAVADEQAIRSARDVEAEIREENENAVAAREVAERAAPIVIELGADPEREPRIDERRAVPDVAGLSTARRRLRARRVRPPARCSRWERRCDSPHSAERRRP
jgi:membrane peptidoglycan carboxypeptidase